MRCHLQHLNALRCFEAAARHQSFSRAADELFVTPAAISHQIRALESALSVKLFERRPIKLTPVGERLVSALSSSFDRINEALSELHENDNPSLLLAVTQTFSTRWLLSRLPRFFAAHPELQLHVQHIPTQFDAVTRGEAEAAVVWTTVRPARVWARRLFGLWLTPVCSPLLINADRPLDSAAAVRDYPLLHDDKFDDWERWLMEAGARDVDVRHGATFDTTSALLVAAVAGCGIGLGPIALTEEDVQLGRLIRPFPQSIEANGAYWLIASNATAARPHFRAFADFLLAESSDLD